jgi:hypothetical protein
MKTTGLSTKPSKELAIWLYVSLVFVVAGFVSSYVGAVVERPLLMAALFALMSGIAMLALWVGGLAKSPTQVVLAYVLVATFAFVGGVAGSITSWQLGKDSVLNIVSPIGGKYLSTHFYELSLEQVDTQLNTPWAVAISDKAVIAVTADGRAYNQESPLEGTKDSEHRVYHISTDTGEGKLLGEISLHEMVSKDTSSKGLMSHRTLDVLTSSVQNGGLAPDTLYISFSSNDFARGCRMLNVAEINISQPVSDDVTQERRLPGSIFFQSECFPFSSTGDKRLHQSGGRIALVPPELRKRQSELELLLSVGDFVKLEANSTGLNQTMKAQLGSVLHIHSGGYEVLVQGLRNPQGLLVADLGGGSSILTSEHGPRGGDEINILSKGRDYGWPEYSYGTAYIPNNLNDKPEIEGQSGDSTPPLFSWVPSIAPSQMVQVEGDEFKKWWSSKTSTGQVGDVLVSSLGGQSIYRIRIEGGAVRYVEPIEVGERIRAFSEMPSGRLVIGTDSGVIYVLSKVKTWSTEAGDFVDSR